MWRNVVLDICLERRRVAMQRKVVGGLFPTSKSTIDWSTGDCSAESYGKLGGAENY